MPRDRTTKLEPWIERLIRSHGTEQETRIGRLKAHVVGVGQISESQAQGIECPPGLLFLSDGVVQIPAILTQDAWENLQDQEDRECLSSLNNCTVCVQAYSLQFNMATEETKCRFFLSVGDLVTIAAGTYKDNTPCCTSLSFVRMMIRTTYRSFIGDSALLTQNTQQGFCLSQLLGDWHHDYMKDLLENIRERLRTQRCTQPSTSSSYLPQRSSVTYTKTGWDTNRDKYKGEDCFCIPISHLLIPDEKTELLRTPSDVGSATPSGLLLHSDDTLPDVQLEGQNIGAFQSITTEVNLQTEEPAPQLKRHSCHEPTFPQESINEELVSEDMVQTKGSPWDMFVPPYELLRTSSSSDVSMTLEPTPAQESPSLLGPIPIPVQLQPVPMATSTQVPSQSSMITQGTDRNRTEHSAFPPYQKPGASHSPVPTKAISLAGSPPSPNLCSGTEHAHKVPLSAREHVEVDGDEQEVLQRRSTNAKRKSSQRTPEEVQRARSPPSWLFESQLIPNAEEGSSCKYAQPQTIALMKPCNVHSDGTLFSYSYHLSGRILDNLSKFRVPNDMLHWAVKQLVLPKQTDNMHNIARDQPRTSPC